MSTRFAWFITPSGRKFMQNTAFVISCGLAIGNVLPNSYYLDRYEDLVSMRKHEKPFPLSPKLEKIVETVLNDMKIPEMFQRLIKPFMVFGYDMWHAGSLQSPYGVRIGIPTSFIYDEVSEVDKAGIIINNQHLNWNKKESKDLLNSLILSDNAKKYAIANEIAIADNQNYLIQGLTSGITFFSWYHISRNINDRFQLLDKPRGIRIAAASLVGAFIYGLWAMQKDSFNKHYEYNSDRRLCDLGIAYVKGGYEYYSKIIQRNIAIRTLSEKNGERTYTQGGNLQILFRQKNLPYTYRKDYFEKKLKDLNDTAASLKETQTTNKEPVVSDKNVAAL